MIVNIDADDQYRAADIPKLVAPILDGRADMVVGDRQVDEIEHFSATKKLLQRLGSWVVRRASGTDVPDTTSGFRAYNREAALQLLVVSNFTYTLESLIQAGKMLVAVEHVPVAHQPAASRVAPVRLDRRVRAPQRARDLPRLRPLRAAAGVHDRRLRRSRIGALAAWSPFLLDWILNGDSTGHVQSLILGAVLAVIAVQMFGLGIIGDALAGQRVITQRVFERVRRLELEAGVEPSHLEPAPGPSRRGRRGGPVEDDLPVDDELAERRDAERGAGRDQVVDVERRGAGRGRARTRAPGRRPR